MPKSGTPCRSSNKDTSESTTLQRSPSNENLLNNTERALADQEEIVSMIHSTHDTGRIDDHFNDDSHSQNSDGEDQLINMRLPAVSIRLNDTEHAIKLAGGFGLYQWYYLLSVQLLTIIITAQYSFTQYSTISPSIVNCQYDNFKKDVKLLPNQNETQHKEFCDIYDAGLCNKTTYESSFQTIIQEWGLICDRDYIPDSIGSLQTVSVILVAPFIGALSDHFGRKKASILSLILLTTSNFLCSMSSGWLIFALFRLISNLAMYATTGVIFIWSMELFDASNNIIINLGNSWTFGFIVSAGICALLRKWRAFLVAFSTLTLPIIVIFTRFEESPRWLIQVGKLDKAAAALTSIAFVNRPHTAIKFKSSNLRNIRREGEKESMFHATHRLLTHKRLAFNLIIQGIITFATASTSVGYLWQISISSGSPYIAFAMLGLIRLLVMPACYIIDRKMPNFGRRSIILWPLSVICICEGITTFSKLSYTKGTSENLEFYPMLVASVTTTFLWIGLGQYAVELFPTTVRNTASAIIYVFDPIAGLIGPQLIFLQEHFWYPIQSVFLFTLTAFVLLSSYLFLPETKGLSVPDTEEETAHPIASPPAAGGVDDGIVIVRTGWRTIKSRLCGEHYTDDEDERRIVGDESNNEDHYWQEDPIIPPSPTDSEHDSNLII